MSTSTEQEKPGAVVGVLGSKPSFGDIPLDCIRASKTNPRKIFDEADLNDLAKSIKVQGVAQPILVRPIETIDGVTYFEIVAGERRFRASGIAGMPTVPAIVRELSDQAAYEIQVLENLQRVDLHPLEEAEGFEVMMSEYKVTADELADKVGKSKAYIYASLKLCALEEGPRKAFYAGLLTKSTALLIARIPVKSLQVKCTEEITAGHSGVLSTRRAQDHITVNYMLNLAKAPFKPEDLDLCKKAGACSTCPKRAGNQPIIFADVAADVCTDPVCFKAKSDAHGARIKQIAIASGKTVISGADAKKIMPYQYSGPQAGYVKLDDRNYDDDKNRTYRQLLGKNDTSVSLLESPHDNRLIEVVKLADIKSILLEKGVGARRAGEKAVSKAREKAQEEKAKAEREFRKQVFMEIHHSTLMVNLIDRDLRLIAYQLFDRMQRNIPSTALVMSAHGWTDSTLSYSSTEDKLRTAVDAFTPAQLNQFIRDCILSRELEVNTYTATGKDEPANLLAYAERAKVDAKKIRSDIDADAKAKADAKQKSADKKAAKAAPPAPAPAKPAAAKKAAVKAQPVKAAAKAKAPAAAAPAPKPATKTAPRIATEAEWPFPSDPLDASGAPAARPPKAATNPVAAASADAAAIAPELEAKLQASSAAAASRNTAPGTSAWPFPTTSRRPAPAAPTEQTAATPTTQKAAA